MVFRQFVWMLIGAILIPNLNILAASPEEAHVVDELVLYKIGSGDTVDLQVYNEVDLSRSLFVDQTCAIEVGLIGRVECCGMTTGELAEVIRGKLSDGYLVKPSVTIEVKDYGSQKVEVLGQVTKRGHQYLDGSRSLLEVINNAGGPKELNVVDVEHFCAETKQSTVYSLAEPDVLSSIFVADGDRVTLRPGRMVYVDGEVAKPGEVPFREGLTVTQALAMAGGPGEYASLRRAFILHGNGKKSLVNIYKINLGKDEDVLLDPDDRLLISRSAF